MRGRGGADGRPAEVSAAPTTDPRSWINILSLDHVEATIEGGFTQARPWGHYPPPAGAAMRLSSTPRALRGARKRGCSACDAPYALAHFSRSVNAELDEIRQQAAFLSTMTPGEECLADQRWCEPHGPGRSRVGLAGRAERRKAARASLAGAATTETRCTSARA